MGIKNIDDVCYFIEQHYDSDYAGEEDEAIGNVDEGDYTDAPGDESEKGDVRSKHEVSIEQETKRQHDSVSAHEQEQGGGAGNKEVHY